MTIFMIVHKQQLLAQQVRNVFYYETTVGDPTPAEWQDIADEIRADVLAELAPGHVDDWNFYAIDYRQVDVAGIPAFEVVPTAGTVVGASAVDPVPSQIALLVSVKAPVTKPNHARTYLAGWTEVHVVQGLFIASAKTEATDFIDLQSVLNSGGTNPLQRVSVQWNSSHTQVIASNNIAAAASVASTVPATQRRRRIGVGI